MARQIGKMLNAREPKIINGPQILDKYVGESEANVRKLFAEAEEEEKRVCGNSLHVLYMFFMSFYSSLKSKDFCSMHKIVSSEIMVRNYPLKPWSQNPTGQENQKFLFSYNSFEPIFPANEVISFHKKFLSEFPQ